MQLQLTVPPQRLTEHWSGTHPSSPVSGVWAQLVEHQLEPLSVSWDAQTNRLRLELITSESAAPSTVMQARRISEVAMRDRCGPITVLVEASTGELATE